MPYPSPLSHPPIFLPQHQRRGGGLHHLPPSQPINLILGDIRQRNALPPILERVRARPFRDGTIRDADAQTGHVLSRDLGVVGLRVDTLVQVERRIDEKKKKQARRRGGTYTANPPSNIPLNPRLHTSLIPRDRPRRDPLVQHLGQGHRPRDDLPRIVRPLPGKGNQHAVRALEIRVAVPIPRDRGWGAEEDVHAEGGVEVGGRDADVCKPFEIDAWLLGSAARGEVGEEGGGLAGASLSGVGVGGVDGDVCAVEAEDEGLVQGLRGAVAVEFVDGADGAGGVAAGRCFGVGVPEDGGVADRGRGPEGAGCVFVEGGEGAGVVQDVVDVDCGGRPEGGRWLHPGGGVEGLPDGELPVHVRVVEHEERVEAGVFVPGEVATVADEGVDGVVQGFEAVVAARASAVGVAHPGFGAHSVVAWVGLEDVEEAFAEGGLISVDLADHARVLAGGFGGPVAGRGPECVRPSRVRGPDHVGRHERVEIVAVQGVWDRDRAVRRIHSDGRGAGKEVWHHMLPFWRRSGPIPIGYTKGFGSFDILCPVVRREILCKILNDSIHDLLV